MRTVTPPRGDVIYTLLKGNLSTENAARGSFGLHVDPNLTSSDVQKMGRAHGFRLIPGAPCQPNVSSICYVHLLPGKDLAAVLRDILTTEPAVSTVNLNYIER